MDRFMVDDNEGFDVQAPAQERPLLAHPSSSAIDGNPIQQSRSSCQSIGRCPPIAEVPARPTEWLPLTPASPTSDPSLRWITTSDALGSPRSG